MCGSSDHCLLNFLHRGSGDHCLLNFLHCGNGNHCSLNFLHCNSSDHCSLNILHRGSRDHCSLNFLHCGSWLQRCGTWQTPVLGEIASSLTTLWKDWSSSWSPTLVTVTSCSTYLVSSGHYQPISLFLPHRPPPPQHLSLSLSPCLLLCALLSLSVILSLCFLFCIFALDMLIN